MVSIIVPMYNSAKFIDRCLKSIMNQSYEDIEIIVINDGSTDGSFEHASELAACDERVHIVSQDNHGLVYSRKRGIEQAKGEYVLFVDSDDYIEPDMVGELVELARDNGADVVLSGAILEIDNSVVNRTVANFVGEGIYEGKELCEIQNKLFCAEDYCTMAVLPYLWNKLWRTAVIKDHVLACDESIRVGEDVAIGFPALLTAEKVVVTNKAYYHYIQYADSMMRSGSNEEAEYDNARRLQDYLVKRCSEIGASDRTIAGIESLYTNQLYTRCYGKANEVAAKCNGLVGFMAEIPDNLVIYGAGELGKAVYKYASGKCNIRAWVDGSFAYYQSLGYDVISPDEYVASEDDTVIIAVFSRRAVEAIHKMLLEKGCNSNRIHTFEGLNIG